MAAGSHQKLYAIIASAVLLLVLSSVLPVPFPLPLLVAIALVLYLGLGFAFGRVWPDLSWRWSVWMLLPVAVIVLMDLFISPPDLLQRDLVILSSTIVGGSVGGFVGARIGASKTREETT